MKNGDIIKVSKKLRTELSNITELNKFWDKIHEKYPKLKEFADSTYFFRAGEIYVKIDYLKGGTPTNNTIKLIN